MGTLKIQLQIESCLPPSGDLLIFLSNEDFEVFGSEESGFRFHSPSCILGERQASKTQSDLDEFFVSFLNRYRYIGEYLSAKVEGEFKLTLVVEFGARFSHSMSGIHISREIASILSRMNCSLSWNASCSRKWMPRISKALFARKFKRTDIRSLDA